MQGFCQIANQSRRGRLTRIRPLFKTPVSSLNFFSAVVAPRRLEQNPYARQRFPELANHFALFHLFATHFSATHLSANPLGRDRRREAELNAPSGDSYGALLAKIRSSGETRRRFARPILLGDRSEIWSCDKNTV